MQKHKEEQDNFRSIDTKLKTDYEVLQFSPSNINLCVYC